MFFDLIFELFVPRGEQKTLRGVRRSVDSKSFFDVSNTAEKRSSELLDSLSWSSRLLRGKKISKNK